MKLLRVGEKNKETTAVLDHQNKIRDISKYFDDFNPNTLNFDTINQIKELDLDTLP
jgi:hypothetical protein